MNVVALQKRTDDAPFDRDPERSFTIPARYYLDADILQQEKEAIFYRNWWYAGHQSQLAEAGCYLTVQVCDQNIIVIRDKSGELNAYYNVCQHRGHELLFGSGKVRTITCPYHAWSYGFDGELKAARNTDKMVDFDKCKFSLKSVQVEVFCGLVFVNLDPAAESLKVQAADLETEIREFCPRVDEVKFAQRDDYDVASNWKIMVDNFLECYHCPVAHKGFSSMIDMDTYKVTTHGIYSSHMAKAKLGENKAYDIADATVTDHAVWFLWPNLTLMRYPGRGNFMVWRFYPINATETWEEFDFFFESSEPDDSEKEAIRFIDEVLQPEDIGLVESVQRGMSTPAFNSGRYMVDIEGSGASEHAVHHFHGLLLNAYQRACNPDA